MPNTTNTEVFNELFKTGPFENCKEIAESMDTVLFMLNTDAMEMMDKEDLHQVNYGLFKLRDFFSKLDESE